MALTTCEECGNSVSTSASACPHCGATPDNFKKIEAEKEKTSGKEHKPNRSGGLREALSIAFFGIIICLFLGVASVFFGGNEDNETTSIAREASAFSDEEICRALIAAVFGRPLDIINVDGEKYGVFYLSYTRPNDGTFWETKCRVDDVERATWGAKDGRWQNDSRDLLTTYSIDGDQITIDEVGNKHTYSKSEF